MERLYLNYYPFSVSAEQKTSRAGKQYTSIGICHKTKDKDGNKKDIYINLIDERDLLVLASVCENMYHSIIKAKNDDFVAKNPGVKDQTPQSTYRVISSDEMDWVP